MPRDDAAPSDGALLVTAAVVLCTFGLLTVVFAPDLTPDRQSPVDASDGSDEPPNDIPGAETPAGTATESSPDGDDAAIDSSAEDVRPGPASQERETERPPPGDGRSSDADGDERSDGPPDRAGGGPPEHAGPSTGERGPPDHAGPPEGDAGPPDHAGP